MKKPSELRGTAMPTEANVVKQCVEYMHSIGWRPKRNHIGLFYTENQVPVSMGTKGEPDWTFTHPKQPAIWIEFKRPGKEPKPEQFEFIAKLKHFGYKAGWCDSLDGLKSLLAEWKIL